MLAASAGHTPKQHPSAGNDPIRAPSQRIAVNSDAKYKRPYKGQ